MKVLISLSLLLMMIHVSLAGPFFKSQKQNREYSQCSDKSKGRKCGDPIAQPQTRRSDAKSRSRDTELSSAGNAVRGHSAPVGAKTTSSSAGQSARSASGRQRRSTSIHKSAQSQSQATPAARVESSRHERLPSDHEEELIEEDEELVAKLRSVLDEMSASEFLELASDVSEEDLIDDEDEEVPSDVTGIAPGNSRTKRGIVFLLKKHLLKGHIRRKLLGKKLRHIGHKARGVAGHAVRLGILGAGAAALGGAAGVGYSSANNN